VTKSNRNKTPRESLGDSRDRKPTPEEKPIFVTVSFTHADVGGKYCLSKCGRKEVKNYKGLLRKITSMSWLNVKTSRGLGFKYYEDSDLKHATRPSTLDQNIPIFGIRLSLQERFFAAFHDDVVYVLWFDPKHKIVPCRGDG